MSPRAVSPRLSLDELSARTGVSSATLQQWCVDHHFPAPWTGLAATYDHDDVVAVQAVDDQIRRGASVEGAVHARRSRGLDPPPSVFAQLRREHPHLLPYRLRKSTLLALSWAIEDELVVGGDGAVLFGAFQRQPYYRSAQERWTELAASATATYVFADFPETVLADDLGDGHPIRVPLSEHDPMLKEWAVVCDSTEVPVVLTASELPGQRGRPERDRVFESIWSLDPCAVRDAARVCAGVACDSGAVSALTLLTALPPITEPGPTSSQASERVFNRVLAYVDWFRAV